MSVETDELDVPYVVRYRVTRPMISAGEAARATIGKVAVVTTPVPQGTRSRRRSSHAADEVDS